MPIVDWRKLYASNRAVIDRAGGVPGDLATAFRAPGHATRPSPGRALPRRVSTEPGALEELTITEAGRTRRALVHPPAGVPSRSALPLVCMLHGCTQDAASFAAATQMNAAALRRGKKEDRGGGPPRLRRRVPAAGAGRQPAALLELVLA